MKSKGRVTNTNQLSQSDHRGGGGGGGGGGGVGLSKPTDASTFHSVPLEETDVLDSFDRIYGGGGSKEASTSNTSTTIMHSNPMSGDSKRLAASNSKSSKGSSPSTAAVSSEQVQVVPGPVSVKKRSNTPDRKKAGSSPMRGGGDGSLPEVVVVSDRKVTASDRARTRSDAVASNGRPASLAATTTTATTAATGLVKAVEQQPDIEAPASSKKGAAAAAEGKKDVVSPSKAPPKKKDRFVGVNGLQYALWGHYLAYGSAMMCLLMGVFAVALTYATTYGCKIDGVSIHPKYLLSQESVDGTTCEATYRGKSVCCDPHRSASAVHGYLWIGIVYTAYSLSIVLFENAYWGYGLWSPNDSFSYRHKLCPSGMVHIAVGLVGMYNYVTGLAGVFLVITGAVTCYAATRQECGDGGRTAAAKAKASLLASRVGSNNNKDNKAKDQSSGQEQQSSRFVACCQQVRSFHLGRYCRRLYNEDRLSSYAWVLLFVAVNAVVFLYYLSVWYQTVLGMEQGLLRGSLDIDCDDRLCHVHRKAIRYGPLSRFAPWAKACGGCLNLNCSLILFPVTRLLLRKINNWGQSFNLAQRSSDMMGRYFARPMTRYLPLQKNIEFHKLCAGAIFLFAWAHTTFHLLNLMVAAASTFRFFRLWRWDYTSYLTGAVVSTAMLLIYSAAPNAVRLSKYEVFFRSHHAFIVFFLFLFLHGPNFFYWSCVPVLLYAYDRYLQTQRGKVQFLLLKVEWIAPVMAVYFRPLIKDQFKYKEGQYLYLNCPHISSTEWHPFTISSAYDDLHNGPRIHLETGEEVYEVPRQQQQQQQQLSHKAAAHRGNNNNYYTNSSSSSSKYCLVSQDHRNLSPDEYIDKSDTGYCDYVSVHVKVHGLDEPHARTWTRKLKEYLELLSGGQSFPFFFRQRDARGDIQLGRLNGPDNAPILRVDGPHSAPSEHYTSYGTVMLVGAGIGLTPCASVLCALTKYRWKKNFNPEVLYFYWIVRHSEVDGFQWLVHMLTELSYEMKKSLRHGQIEKRYYCEIHIYITGAAAAGKDPIEVAELHRAKKVFSASSSQDDDISSSFTADELYYMMCNPKVSSKTQVATMKEKETSHHSNRLQDIWVWEGRPHWDQVFKEVRDQRQHSDIGVCFCGAPVIGADLVEMCQKYSNVEDQVGDYYSSTTSIYLSTHLSTISFPFDTVSYIYLYLSTYLSTSIYLPLSICLSISSISTYLSISCVCFQCLFTLHKENF